MELAYFEVLQMIQAMIDRLEGVFQYWMSATFAAIVASHLSGEKLTKIYAGMLTALYLIFTISVAVRMAAWNTILERYSGMLLEIRKDPTVPSGMGTVIVGSLWVTLILGAIATLVFIWHSYSTNKKDSVAPTHSSTHLPERDLL